MRQYLKLSFLAILLISLAMRSSATLPDWLWGTSSTGAGTGNKTGEAVTVDPSGNIYVTGYFSTQTISFGNIILSNSGDKDIFLVKYNASGVVLWAKSFGAAGAESPESIVTDGNGNLYITGFFFSHALNFDATTLVSQAPVTGLLKGQEFLAKLDALGNVLWAKTSSQTPGTEAGGTSLSVDLSGNVYEAGYFWSPTLNLGAFTLINEDQSGLSNDLFVAKYDAAGNVLWAKSAGGVSKDICYSVSADASGAVYITGKYYSSIINFSGTVLTNAGMCNLFLAKYDAVNGNELWARSFGGNFLDFGSDVAGDGLGNIYLTGFFYSPTILFGNTTLTNPDSAYARLFLAKLDTAGNTVWAKTASGKGVYGQQLAFDSSGHICLMGSYTDKLVLDTITFVTSYNVNNIGNNHIFIACYNDTGAVLWAKDAGGSRNDMAEDMTTDAFGNLYLTGAFTSPAINFGTSTLSNTTAGFSAEMFLAKIGSNITGVCPSPSTVSHTVIYPNPVGDRLNVRLKNGDLRKAMTIYDLNGRLLISGIALKAENSINTAMLPSGGYILKITDAANGQTERIPFIKRNLN